MSDPMIIGREFHYDSAHRLPNVAEGHKCGRLHGHTYRLIVEVEGAVGEDGFVIDFADIDNNVDYVLRSLDHYYLNEVEGLENPTVENQLVWLWSSIDLPLKQLILWEGLKNYGRYDGKTTALFS